MTPKVRTEPVVNDGTVTVTVQVPESPYVRTLDYEDEPSVVTEDEPSDDRVSLYPLDPEEALAALLSMPRSPETE